MTVKVTARGAERWKQGHPWIYRSDVAEEPDKKPGIVPVTDRKGKFLGQALYSPSSEIRLRLLTRGKEDIDAQWWAARIAAAAGRRNGIDASAWRVVHAEGDGLPSLIIDKYGPWIVAQLLSAGLETARADVLAGVTAALTPEGILLRNDAAVRRHEGLPAEVVLAVGQVDLFTYHGSFALHLARRAKDVVAVDQSTEALARGAENARLNGITNIEWREANAFDLLRELERRRDQFDTIVIDPPAFAKTRANLERAVAGYKEVNLRAMKILAPDGVLFTSSCSYHVSRDVFNAMLADAARDSGRRMQFIASTGAAADHPELLNVPETGYLKGVLLRAV